MLDRTIPFYNVIMRCDSITPTIASLPKGYTFQMYHEGNEIDWAHLEYEIGDFNTLEEAQAYFKSTYLTSTLNIYERCVFVVNPEGKIVGSCIAWNDDRQGSPVASLHWLIVSPKYQGLGIGKALCCKVLEIFHLHKEIPVYIHTQPWSWKAILLYISLGFKIQKTDTFSHYENQYDQAMETLRKVVSEKQYELIEHATDY